MSMGSILKSKAIDVMTATLAASLIVGAPLPLFAQQHSARAVSAPAAQEEESTGPQKPGQEGIRVHGHWILDVHDKDGKLVEHRDFQNALTPILGNSMLLRMLAGTAIPERFSVYLTSDVVAGNGTALYGMAQANSYGKQYLCDGTYYICNTSLVQTLTGPEQHGAAVAIQLSGQLTADKSLTFSKVQTFLNVCEDTHQDNSTASQNQIPLNVSPSACVAHQITDPINGTGGSFTGTTITPLSMVSGQVLSVTVTLSFS